MALEDSFLQTHEELFVALSVKLAQAFSSWGKTEVYELKSNEKGMQIWRRRSEIRVDTFVVVQDGVGVVEMARISISAHS